MKYVFDLRYIENPLLFLIFVVVIILIIILTIIFVKKELSDNK